MGFLCNVDLHVPKLIASSISKLVAHFRFMFMMSFFHLGLLEMSQDQVHTALRHGECMEKIKRGLPIVEFGEYMEMSGRVCEELEQVCAVCLSCLERRHEVRELTNCSHVFHRECLDKWVDKSQSTCPLCRSSLLPEEEEEVEDDTRSGRGGEHGWLVERISYIFAEEDD